MDENRKALRKGLQLILQLDAKMKYANISDVKKIHAAIGEKNILHTQLGKRYTLRLQQIVEGTANSTCIFCGKEASLKSVLCATCRAKVQPQERVCVSQEDRVSSTQNVSSTMQSKEKFKNIKENIKDTIGRKGSVALKYVKEFWKQRTKKQKIVIVSILAVLLIGVFAGGEESASESASVGNAESAYKIVNAMYPESKYDIITKQAIYPAKEMFEVGVGDYCGDSWNDDTCKAYVFFVQSKKEALYSAVLWVNEEGRVVGYGSLVSGLNDDITQSYPTYRIK